MKFPHSEAQKKVSSEEYALFEYLCEISNLSQRKYYDRLQFGTPCILADRLLYNHIFGSTRISMYTFLSADATVNDV